MAPVAGAYSDFFFLLLLAPFVFGLSGNYCYRRMYREANRQIPVWKYNRWGDLPTIWKLHKELHPESWIRVGYLLLLLAGLGSIAMLIVLAETFRRS